MTLENRSWCARWDGMGAPTIRRLTCDRKRFFGHDVLQRPTGLADGLEVGVLYPRSLAAEPRTSVGFAPVTPRLPVGPPYRARPARIRPRLDDTLNGHK